MARGKDHSRIQARALFAEAPASPARPVNNGNVFSGAGEALSGGGGGRSTGGQSVLLAVGSVLLTASGSAISLVYSQMQERAAQAEKLSVERAASLNSVASIIDTRIIRAVQVQKALKLGAPTAELDAAWAAYQDAFIGYNDNSVKTYIAIRKIIQQERPTFFERAINNDITPVLSKWDQCLSYAYRLRVEAEREASFRGSPWWGRQPEISAAAGDCGNPAPIIRACSGHVLNGLYDMSLRDRSQTPAAEAAWLTDPSRFSQIRVRCPAGYDAYWRENGRDITHRPATTFKLYTPKFGEARTAARGLRPADPAPAAPEDTLAAPSPQSSLDGSFGGNGLAMAPSRAPTKISTPKRAEGFAAMVGRTAGSTLSTLRSLGAGKAQAAEAH
ncbi:MAG: hypothetical protein K9G59_07480 [Caulobacter sp.]|nr:hypothetical protein [Caulobacter sp.]